MESRREFAIVVAIAALILPAWSPAARGAAAELKATNPSPADGATGVTLALLEWTPGATAVWHDVYVGAKPQPGPADFKGRQPLGVSMYFYSAGLTPWTTYTDYFWEFRRYRGQLTAQLR